MEKSIKILVISNSLGNTGPILTALDKEKPDIIFHLGGGIRDLSELNFGGRIFAVRSGGEFGKRLPTASKINYAKEVFLLAHGDGMSLKNKQKLTDFALGQGATILLVGCDDEPAYFEQNGVKIVCPGSIHDRMTATYAVITLPTDGEPIIEHRKLIED